MKNYLIFIVAFFLFQQTFSQNTFDNIKLGSNLENGKYASIEGTKIYYETYGQGTPLLLLHGGLGSIENFENSIPSLASKYFVIAVDSPGHGRSGYTDSLSYPLLSSYMSKFIDYLKLDSLYVMGLSDGGIIGLILAANRPDKVRKLVAVGANSRLDGMNKEIIGWIKNDLINWAKNDTVWRENYLALAPQPDMIDSYLILSQAMWLTEVYISPTMLNSIQIPIMLLQGDRDLISIEHVAELHRTIKKSQLCIIPDASHFVLNEKPDLVNQIAIDFFNVKKK